VLEYWQQINRNTFNHEFNKKGRKTLTQSTGHTLIFALRLSRRGSIISRIRVGLSFGQVLMFPNQDHGRMMVTEEGSLIIESVRKQDSGEYICKGLSAAGSAYAKAKLQVRGTYRMQDLLYFHTLVCAPLLRVKLERPHSMSHRPL